MSWEQTKVIDTLTERSTNYGKFVDQAQWVQGMKDVVRLAPSWDGMSYDQKESIDMILGKISRIVNGNPNHVDSWHDISGYAKLIEDRLNGIGR